jgi:hypothetical protein
MTRVLPLALALAACAAPSITANAPARSPDPRLVAQATQSAANQVKRCYRSPKLSRDARQITTRLRVRYAPDGELMGFPIVVSQSSVTAANRPYATTMAQAAISAVINCSPLKLPPELHARGWDEFELTFSPPSFA